MGPGRMPESVVTAFPTTTATTSLSSPPSSSSSSSRKLCLLPKASLRTSVISLLVLFLLTGSMVVQVHAAVNDRVVQARQLQNNGFNNVNNNINKNNNNIADRITKVPPVPARQQQKQQKVADGLGQKLPSGHVAGVQHGRMVQLDNNGLLPSGQKVSSSKTKELEDKRKKEIERQIKEHEEKMLAKQKKIEEFEKQRQQRQKILDEHRRVEEAQQQLRAQQAQKLVQDRHREREKEQQWLETMKKSKADQQGQAQAQSQQDLKARGRSSANQAQDSAGRQNPDPIRANLNPPVTPSSANNNNNNLALDLSKNRQGRDNFLNHRSSVGNKTDTGNALEGNRVRNDNQVDNNNNNDNNNMNQNGQHDVGGDNNVGDNPPVHNQVVKEPDSARSFNDGNNNNNQHGEQSIVNLKGVFETYKKDKINQAASDNSNREINRDDNQNVFQNNQNMPERENNPEPPRVNNADANNPAQNNFINDNVGNNNNMNNNNGDRGNGINNNGQSQSVGGIHLNWDWEDFAILFDNYGGAEMKVRRAPHASTGEPWPMPQYYSKKDNKVYRISKELRFVPTGHTCDILDEAMSRHLQRILRGAVEDMYDNLQNAEGTFVNDPNLRYEKDEFLKALTLTRVELKVRKPCEKYPSLESDESYDLVVKKKKTFIYANEIWGLLRGLETLGHLVWKGTDGMLYIKETVISDYPRFQHRGLLIDTSRHYLFKETIFDILDSMEMNKLNMFHWHITDDQSFPYESKVYPELSRRGAFHPSYVYSLEDITEIVEYARMRGVRVMPEFDTPGHTYAWGLSRPELLTQCFSGPSSVKGYLGPIDPSKNSTYRFLETLFQEIMDVFKDKYMHLGGDEVPLSCWQSNPEVMAFAQELNRKAQEEQANNHQGNQQQQQQQPFYNNGFGWNTYSDEIKRVYEYYENRLMKILTELGRKRKTGVHYIMWQEVMNNNLQLPNDTIIQIWMGDMSDVMRAISMGYRVIYSTCWYLDHIEYGTKWPKYYQCDPVDQSYGYHIDEKKVLGGEIAFWSEYFTNENLIPLMWPRASAGAERLWSSKEVKNLDTAAERLAEHRCRMLKRGIQAGEISGPGYCLHAPPKRRMYNDTVGCKGGNCSRTHNFVEIEDIQVHLSQRGGSLSECGHVFSRGDNNVIILPIMALLVVIGVVALTRSSSRLHRAKMCKNRLILMVFLFVLLVYFLCYTTIWMRAFEFSGSFHKTFQEDQRDTGNSGGNSEGFKNIGKPNIS